MRVAAGGDGYKQHTQGRLKRKGGHQAGLGNTHRICTSRERLAEGKISFLMVLFFFNLFIYFCCVGSSFLREGFL